MVAGDTLLGHLAEQLRDGRSFVEEEPRVCLWFRGSGQSSAERFVCKRMLAHRVVGEGLQHTDLEGTPRAPRRLGSFAQPVQGEDQLGDGLAPFLDRPVAPMPGEHETRHGQKIELLQVADVVRDREPLIVGPLGGLGEPALGDPDAGLERGKGTDIW